MDKEDVLRRLTSLGAHACGEVAVAEIVRRSVFREACMQNRCGSYGKSWTCPPAEDGFAFEDAAALAEHAVVFQHTAPLEDSFDADGMAAAQGAFQELCLRAAESFPDGRVFGTGPCTACAKCAYPEPCRRGRPPQQNLEAACVDVAKLCEAAGLPYMREQPSVTYTGLLLLGARPTCSAREMTSIEFG